MTWALPLVLMIGVVAVLVLRRFVVSAPRSARQSPRMSVCESVVLSDDTRVHLIEIDSRTYVVVESARQSVLHAVQPQTSDSPGTRARFGPSWARHFFHKEGSR